MFLKFSEEKPAVVTKTQEEVPKLDLSKIAPASATPTSSPRKDSPTFNLAELDQMINLELRTASDQPKYSRKDALKVRHYVLEQVITYFEKDC